ncbi:MAG: Uma2 family endonuclease [Pirellulales bacterium]
MLRQSRPVELKPWTPADLVERFGQIPLYRVRTDPEPGTATEEDLLYINRNRLGLCELVDGTLIEKDFDCPLPPSGKHWKPKDLVSRFGQIPLRRVRTRPPPGSATEEDLIELNERGTTLYELVDGTLVEKAMGWNEAVLESQIGSILTSFVNSRKLGIVASASGPYRLAASKVRLPDVSFVSAARLSTMPATDEPICSAIPDLVIAVIAKSNTRREMEQKLEEYFTAGVRLVWYVYPRKRETHVFVSPTSCQVLTENETIDGGDVLPDFKLALKELFAVLAQRSTTNE